MNFRSWVPPTQLEKLRSYPHDEDHPRELDELEGKPTDGWVDTIKKAWQDVSSAAWRAARLANPSKAEADEEREAARAPARESRQRQKRRDDQEWRDFLRSQRVNSDDDDDSTEEEYE